MLYVIVDCLLHKRGVIFLFHYFNIFLDKIVLKQFYLILALHDFVF